MSNVTPCQSPFALRSSLFAILFSALAFAEPTVWPVPFEARAMFPAVLDLARASACKDIAALVDREDYGAALALTEKTVAGPFLWRGALTNGYQQGFCLYALHGLLLEQHGEVVRAYRAYQNSRACFNDDTVMAAQPEPRLEVFAGIGRLCVEAGRYYDALQWLETVRIEGNGVPYLCALADRGLIRRAVEIGDYHDALTNYWDLQAQLAAAAVANLQFTNYNLQIGAEGTTKTRRHQEIYDLRFTNYDLDVQFTNYNVAVASCRLRSQAGSSTVEAASGIGHPISIRGLSRAEYRELAQLYFWTWRDREGFAQVLDGITLLGIDNDLGVRDPMIDCFLNNIMRADDAEIQRFYDLLGYAITQARALKGDEEYLAHVLRTRQVMHALFSWLRPDDDVAALQQRINEVRSVLLQQRPKAAAMRTSRSVTPANQNHKAQDELPEEKDSYIRLEDALMAADYHMKCYRYGYAGQALETARRCLAKARAQAQCYDDTTYEDALTANYNILAVVRGSVTQQIMHVQHLSPHATVASWRGHTARVLVEREQIRCALHSCAHERMPCVLDCLSNEPYDRVNLSLLVDYAARTGHLDEASHLYGKLLARICLVPGTAAALIGAYIQRGEYQRAMTLLVEACELAEDSQSRQHFYTLLLATSSWADDTMKKRLVMLLPRAALSLYGERKSCFAEVRHLLQYVLPRQAEIDNALEHRRYEDALALLTPDCDQPRHWLQRAAAFTALGRMEQAAHARMTARQRIEEILEQCGVSTNDIRRLMCPSNHIAKAELVAHLP